MGQGSTTNTANYNIKKTSDNKIDMTAISSDIYNYNKSRITNTASTCSSSNNLTQQVIFRNIRAKSMKITNLTLSQIANIDFSCSAITNSVDETSLDIQRTIESALQNTVSTDFVSEVANSQAASTASDAIGSFKSDVQTNINDEQYVRTQVSQIVSQEMKTNIQDIMETNASKNCISDFSATQRIIFEDIAIDCDGVPLGVDCGDLTVDNFNLEQQLTSFTDCVLDFSSVNKAAIKTMTDLGVSIGNVASTSGRSEVESATTAKTEGLGEGLANAARGIGAAIGSILGGAAFAFLAPIIAIAVVGIVGFFIFKKFMPGFSLFGSKAASVASTAASVASPAAATAPAPALIPQVAAQSAEMVGGYKFPKFNYNSIDLFRY